MRKSPTACGISWAMIATAAMMPTSVLCRNAAAMSRPSTKLCTVSPTTMSAPLRPRSFDLESCGSCTSQFSVWQWRQRSSFSMMKKAKMPPRMAIAAWCGSPRAKAWGMTSRKAAPSSAPMANDTSIGTQLARTVSESAARPADRVPPATLAARIQPSVMGVGILREPDQRGHAAGAAVAAIGIEPLRVGVGAETAAEDPVHALLLQPRARHRVEVEQPVAGARRRKSVLLGERGAHFVADLVDAGPDSRPEPGDQLACAHSEGVHRRLDHSGRHAAPARMRAPDYRAGRVGQQQRHAVRDLDRAHGIGRAGDGRIAFESPGIVEVHDLGAVHLPQP